MHKITLAFRNKNGILIFFSASHNITRRICRVYNIKAIHQVQLYCLVIVISFLQLCAVVLFCISLIHMALQQKYTKNPLQNRSLIQIFRLPTTLSHGERCAIWQQYTRTYFSTIFPVDLLSESVFGYISIASHKTSTGISHTHTCLAEHKYHYHFKFQF